MNNNMKNMTKKKKMMMRGFMCQSPSAMTAVCMNPEFGSVIVPRRVPADQRSSLIIDDTRLTDNAKYTRLIHSNRFNQLSDKKSLFVPPINNNNNNNNKEDQVLPQKHPSVPDSSNHVFQVSYYMYIILRF